MNTILARDINQIQVMDEIIADPSRVHSMEDKNLQLMVDGCLERLRTVRMGGRSASLVCLSVILWQKRKVKADVYFNTLDVEALIAMAFQISQDPSYIQPEWAIFLAGVLLAGYTKRLSNTAKNEVLKQSRLLLQFLSQKSRSPSVRSASKELLKEWDRKFRDGLDSVIQRGYSSWPSSGKLTRMADKDLNKLLKKVLAVLPGDYSRNDFALYRLFLERKGTWKLLQSVSLR